jgi:hypothetical protein
MNTWRLASVVLFAASVWNIFAAEDDHWSPQFGGPGVEGTIFTAAVNGSDVYVGGMFSVVGEAVSAGIAKWDGAHWRSLAGGVKGPVPLVYAVAFRGADVYAGGIFTNVGGVAARNLARWNGSGWAAVGGGVNGTIASLEVVGNNLFVGGNFTQAGTTAITNVARWDGTNWWPLGDGLTGNTNGTSPFVTSLEADTDGNLFAAGLFRFAGALPVNNIARWDGNQWHALGSGLHTGTSPLVSDIVVRGSNVFAAGSFRSAGGLNITNLARWDGTQWNTLGGGAISTNTCLAFVGDTLYTAGNFTSISGVAARHVARWNGAAWEPLTAGTAGEVSSRVSCLAGGVDRLYAGGDFVRAGGAGVLGIAQWDGSSWAALMGPNTHGMFLGVREIRVVGDDIYFGGTMTTAGGLKVGGIAHWNGTTWDAMNGGVNSGGSISTIVESGGQIYVGGSFTNIGGVTARNVARWDGFSWYPLASGLNSIVAALVFHQGQLFAGGSFTARGNNTGGLHGIAVWDGNDWQDVPVISSWRINNAFAALASDGNNLYAGGNFYIGWQDPLPPHAGDDLDNIGYWDGVNWHSMGSPLGITVNALAFYNGELYAGGSFTANAAGTSLKRVARWNGSSWVAVGAGFENGSVSTLAASANYLYAGGSFTNTGGNIIRRIARWNGSQWSALGSGATNSVSASGSSVSGIGISGDDVYLGGTFNFAGAKPSMGVGRWNETISFVPPTIYLLDPLWQSGQFSFAISGLTAGTYKVDATTNFVDWEEIYAGDASASTNVTDFPPANLPHRAYRVRTP